MDFKERFMFTVQCVLFLLLTIFNIYIGIELFNYFSIAFFVLAILAFVVFVQSVRWTVRHWNMTTKEYIEIYKRR